jgi:hypothetical protein
MLEAMGLELALPSVIMVDAAANLLPAVDAWDGSEGPRPRVVVAPGSLTLERRDYARAERTQERWLQARRAQVAYLAAHLEEFGWLPDSPDPTRVVSDFSRKSRGRMTKVLTQLDYTPMFGDGLSPLLTMSTLTYPGDWLDRAPNGRAVKRHLLMFRKRFYRAWGFELVCCWKLEFQWRGAPHFHFLHAAPSGFARAAVGVVGAGLSYPQWLSVVWPDIVAHPDPEQRRRHEAAGTGVDWATGLTSRDPKRISVYFTKHSLYAAKEYQHRVPDDWRLPGAGPGRFWGYWGLSKATRAVELSEADYLAVVRIMRRWVRAQGTTREVSVRYTRGGRPESKYAEVIGLAGAQLVAAHRVRWRVRRRPVGWLANGAGFVSVNDGPAMASVLARFLSADVGESAADRRVRLVAATGSIREMVRTAEMALCYESDEHGRP